MISAATWFGGAHAQAIPIFPSVLTVDPRFARFWTLRTGGVGVFITLPDPTLTYAELRLGGPPLRVWNSGTGGGAGSAFDVQDHLGTVLVALPVDQVGTFYLGAAVSATARSAWDVEVVDYAWYAQRRARLT